MPLPGGAADKFGNRYEGRWTVYCMTQILHEKASSIYLEPVDNLGEGVEFILRLPDGTRQFHQVKRQNGSLAPWSIANLSSERINVLQHFWSKLQMSDTECVFVSMSSADVLQQLSERARSSRTIEEFQDFFVNNQKLSAELAVLQQNGEVVMSVKHIWAYGAYGSKHWRKNVFSMRLNLECQYL